MTTFADDFVRLHLTLNTVNIPVTKAGLGWPPPEKIFIDHGGKVREATKKDSPTYVLTRRSMSRLTDEERSATTHVARGAVYSYTKRLM